MKHVIDSENENYNPDCETAKRKFQFIPLIFILDASSLLGNILILFFFYIDFFINRPIAITFFYDWDSFCWNNWYFVSILDEFANQVCGSYSWFTGTNTQKRKKKYKIYYYNNV